MRNEKNNNNDDGTIKWSTGIERIYLAIPDESNSQIVELIAFTTLEANKIYYNYISDVEYYPLQWEDNLNGHDYVDLGLPSGLLWATCNVGSSTPEGYGNYYAWGETSTKDTYPIDNSVTYSLTLEQLLSQGYIDSEGNLTPQYDAATVNWGSEWRMPTKAEYDELMSKCTYEITTQNDVKGCKMTGPNGNHIFFPAAGYIYLTSPQLVTSRGYYWSSTYYSDDTNPTYSYAFSYLSGLEQSNRGRNTGCSVRPVLKYKFRRINITYF